MEFFAPSALDLLLTAVFFLIAALYSSVGHAGASGYIAAMTLLGLASPSIRPVALSLNIIVASIALIRFAGARLVDARMLLPFVAGSMPMAFWAGQWQLPLPVFKLLLGAVLLLAAFRLAQDAMRSDSFTNTAAASVMGLDHSSPVLEPARLRFHPGLALPIGAAIGLIAGLTGTGGAIFLTPLLLFARWAPMRHAAGMSAAFVLCTSIAGLLGQTPQASTWPKAMPWWLIAVALGALLGSQLGIARWNENRLRMALAVVLLIAAGKLILV